MLAEGRTKQKIIMAWTSMETATKLREGEILTEENDLRKVERGAFLRLEGEQMHLP